MAHREQRIPGKPRDQTTEQAREGRQPTDLHFVTVAVNPLRGHFPVRKAEDERSIRAHVMRDYRRQKKRAVEPIHSSPADSKLSDHLIQFRVPLRGKRKVSRRGTNEASLDEYTSTSASSPRKTRALMPKDQQQSLRKVVLSRSIVHNALYNNLSPFNTSTPEASALLHYYYHSYWDNSLAVNPEGQWMCVAASDPAMFHATLCIVALHKAQTRGGGPQANSYFWHRGEAMRLISQNLTDPTEAISDATIGAVAVLSASDNSMHWPSMTQTSHLEGMITLVGLRGGLHGMNTNRHIQRVVAWADVLHAAAHNSLPQLGIAQYTAGCEMQCLKDVVKQHHDTRVAAAPDVVVPAFFQQVLEDLQTLATARSLLVEESLSNRQEMRPIFSSLLFIAEHRILHLSHPAATSTNPAVAETLPNSIEAIKAASLIFTSHFLRDIALTASFFDPLVQRLRDGISGIYPEEKNSPNPAAYHTSSSSDKKVLSAPLLLWLYLTGLKACAIPPRQPHREFFVNKAAVLCSSVGIDSVEELSSYIDRSGFMAEYYVSACEGLWADITTQMDRFT